MALGFSFSSYTSHIARFYSKIKPCNNGIKVTLHSYPPLTLLVITNVEFESIRYQETKGKCATVIFVITLGGECFINLSLNTIGLGVKA